MIKREVKAIVGEEDRWLGEEDRWLGEEDKWLGENYGRVCLSKILRQEGWRSAVKGEVKGRL